ncbi:MAG: alpha-glucosidase/alpha-galactosidase [Verrucomicrobiales bacterium]|jgi:alpha-galactosidase|nr:alpha-glucosidase/alpha-galactosidase [Verrucomicrobiales bacterium]
MNSSTSKTEIKIAYIGGGSRCWALNLIGDLVLSTQLTGSLVLHDIDHEAAQYNVRLADVIFAHPAAATRFSVSAEQSLGRALKGADFVVISIEPGPTQLRHADLEIPARHGILQTVGDTTGPGGILRALRCIPTYRGFARAIMEHCPKAWVINYTNPMAVCTATLYREAPGIKAFGCCHEVFGTQQKLARLINDWFKTGLPERNEIELDIAGVNHFTWATRAHWRGRDLLPLLRDMVNDEKFFANRRAEAETAAAEQRWFDHHFLVACDLLRRFGFLGAAGDRHLAEFVPWYLGSEAELHRWGVVLTPYSWRLQRSQEPRPTANDQKDLLPSGEEGVQQIEALLGLRPLTTNVNLPNLGQMPGFPEHAVVETYAEFRRDNLRPLLAGPLPEGAACLVKRAVSEHLLTLDAGFDNNPHAAFQALLNHPLMRLPTDQALIMFSEMLNATADYLEQPEKWRRFAG